MTLLPLARQAAIIRFSVPVTVDQVHGDLSALKPLGLGHHIALFQIDLGPQGGQTLQVLVYGPLADGAAAGHSETRARPRRATRGPMASTEARMVFTRS